MVRPKRGDRYVNYIGDMCVVKSIYKDLIKIQVLGKRARTESWSLEDFLNDKKYKFYRIPYPDIDRTNVSRHLLEYQLNMIGRYSAEIKSNPNWFKIWTITDLEYNYFKAYAIPLLKKVFKINTNKAESILTWFDLQFGLKRKRNE